mmetsp:Transcript_25631/g.60077  ORF Transcript_25631/g.60077 Transcript_25631/m.60077 type:complete len:81 (-) Transcript_25631:542-784(-)
MNKFKHMAEAVVLIWKLSAMFVKLDSLSQRNGSFVFDEIRKIDHDENGKTEGDGRRESSKRLIPLEMDDLGTVSSVRIDR